MDQRNIPLPHFLLSKTNLFRVGIALAFAAFVILPIFTVSSASLSQRSAPATKSTASAGDVHQKINRTVGPLTAAYPFLSPFPQAPAPESVATYASDCTTPKQNFEVGETACAKAQGTLFGFYRIYWVNSQGVAVQADIVSASNPTASWVVTASGNWKAYLSDADSSLRSLAHFGGSDPAVAAVDLSVSDTVISTSSFVADGLVSYEVWVLNNGPDAAANVTLVQTVPNNAVRETQASVQDSGPSFVCTDSATDTTCTITSLASGASAYFTFIYKLNSGVPVGTSISNTATVSSDISELHAPDNTAATQFTVLAGTAPATCILDCPSNITKVADSGQNGAFVTYSSAEGIGTCGEINTSTPSGSFFPLGTTEVTVTSTEGGGGCTFSVTIVTEGAPTISCPEDQTITAESGADSASVDVGTPTTTPSSGVSVSGVRSDSQGLTAPYPVGTTFITWTATSTSNGLSASCTQKIVINSDGCGSDAVDPTITAPADVSLTTPPNTGGSCGFVVGESELGTAVANDNCSFNVTRTGVPSGNFFPVGPTTVTYTVTDAAGNTASDTQLVTVVDGTKPAIEAPADASYACPSEVPAANASQATRGDVFDENGNLLPPGPPSDNCGTPVVTVTQSTNGGAGSASSPLVITRTFTATDAAGNSASDDQVITVIDNTAPTITAPADASYQCASGVPAGGAGDATASDNCGTATVAFSETNNGGAGTTASPLVITRTYTATDSAGNSASDSQTITVIDNLAPTVTAPADASYQCASGVPAGGAGDATASDNCGTATVAFSESNNGGAGTTASPLVITRTYTATDSAGNSASDDQVITVIDNTAPTVTAPADASYQCASGIPEGDDSDATASDNCGTATVAFSESNNGGAGTTASPLVITRTYTATDSAGNSASDSQTITVIDDTAPTIALNGANPQVVECHTSYTELGATATDNCSGSFAATPSGSVNVNVPGDYTITYNASDVAGNAATPVTRTVRVQDTIKPEITVNGADPATVECHTSYTDAGATASDSCDSSVPVITTGSVNVNVPGTYTLTYSATDDSGNAADTKTRTVNVVDTTLPTITLNGYAPSMWPPNHKYTTFQLTQFVTGASDTCDLGVDINDVVIEKVTSDELENSGGDGNTLNDIVIAANCKSVQLRSERDGGSNGRVYTITFKVTDASGKVGRATAKVVVPNNNGQTAVDSGVNYTVNGNCP